MNVDLTSSVYCSRFSSVQSGLVKALERVGLHSRLFAEPDPGVEVPLPDAGRQTDGALVPRPVSGPVTRRGGHRHWGGRRDTTILERLLQDHVPPGEQERTQLVYSRAMKTARY